VQAAEQHVERNNKSEDDNEYEPYLTDNLSRGIGIAIAARL
jgi:hypothetical protein